MVRYPENTVHLHETTVLGEKTEVVIPAIPEETMKVACVYVGPMGQHHNFHTGKGTHL